MKQLSFRAINPFRSPQDKPENPLPIFIVPDLKIFPLGNDTLLGIPDALDNGQDLVRDLGIDPGESGLTADGSTVVNSAQFSGLNRNQARDEILKFAKDKEVGGYITSSKLKNWLISRQR